MLYANRYNSIHARKSKKNATKNGKFKLYKKINSIAMNLLYCDKVIAIA